MHALRVAPQSAQASSTSRRGPRDAGPIARRARALLDGAVVGSMSVGAGPVAQWLEPTAHNGLVAGSSPAGPTTHSLPIRDFPDGCKTGAFCGAARGRVVSACRPDQQAQSSRPGISNPESLFPGKQRRRLRRPVRRRAVFRDLGQVPGAAGTIRRACHRGG
jgi:hypothetical protein